MTYVPSDSERLQTSIIQLLSIVFYFLPGVVTYRSKMWNSPYVRFWIKGNTIWSSILFVPFAVLCALSFSFDLRGPIVVAWSVHAIMTIMCACASMFNRPVGYFIVTNRCCLPEMSQVYGAVFSQADEDDD